eukprot:CAMPEP_0119005130 /NCGR_PEP_ID=MMETSP1176-20130426/1544_1 /TAXON_ID=265551 /ORGANISM="Synedropsis recta cf, Strain CCMP1620" /LENGTH=309 /DNA_ID=CAMNT_0006956903 /DNA_START=1 /DNA_END=927 /DNA_ORIENTATION=+
MKRVVSTTYQSLPFMEPIHVLGGGSIGLLFASSIRMAFPSYPLTMLLRKHHEPRLEAEGTRKKFMEVCISHRNRPRIVRIPAAIIDASKNNETKIRNLLVATKAPDASAAIESVRPNLHPSSRIMVLCNGALAVRDEINELLNDEHRITLISTTHGAFRDDDDGPDDELYHVTHAGVGKTFVQSDAPLAQLLDQSGLQAESKDDMELHLWQKLAANCTINPLTAILGCTNGQVAQEDMFRTMVPGILEELSQVSCYPQELRPDLLQGFVDQVIADTMDNKSSMLQDVLRKKRTEIDYLNGYVVKKGLEL